MPTFKRGHSAEDALARNRRTIKKITPAPPYARELNPAIPRDATILTLLARDGDRCYLCRNTAQRYDIEHIAPRCHGGTDELWNLALACPGCNNRKADHLVSIRIDDRSPVYHLAR